MENKGWTVTYTRWDDGEIWVAGRFRTTKEKDEFIKKISRPNSGWFEEELNSLCIINDYYYKLPR